MRTSTWVVVFGALCALGCSRKVEGTWRGMCQVERTEGANGTPTLVDTPVPVTVSVNPEGGRYRMDVTFGTTACAWRGAQGAETTRNGGATELSFPAMPCSSVEGDSTGGNGHFTLQNGSSGVHLYGGADRRGLQLNLRECVVSQ